MKKSKIVSIIATIGLIVLLFCTPMLSFGNEIQGIEKEIDKFKVIGYYSGDLFNESVEKLQTNKLTHIMYAFLIPNEDGTLKPLGKPELLESVIKKAHGDGCKVYIALGGWSYDGKPLVSIFEKVAADNTLRANLVENVVNFTVENNLDGVELDWEHPNAKTIGDYEKLVVALAKSLKTKGKNLTAAVNGAWSTTAGPEVSKLMTDQCLNSFEFVSVMAYDMNNEEHSPLWFANTSTNYWLNRGVSAEKIVVGMPLYARPSWRQYRHLVEQNAKNAYKDYVATSPNVSYYNGLNTLREKTVASVKKAGGIMFFDVNEDVDWRSETLGKYSAVSETYKVIQNAEGLTQEEKKNLVSVVLDNQLMEFNKYSGLGIPFLDKNHRTLVPMRKLLEAVGAELTWDNQAKVAMAKKSLPVTNEYPAGRTITVSATIGEKFITVNEQRVEIDTEAVMKDGRIYLPARAVLEPFGYGLSWSDAGSTVYIKSEK